MERRGQQGGRKGHEGHTGQKPSLHHYASLDAAGRSIHLLHPTTIILMTGDEPLNGARIPEHVRGVALTPLLHGGSRRQTCFPPALESPVSHPSFRVIRLASIFMSSPPTGRPEITLSTPSRNLLSFPFLPSHLDSPCLHLSCVFHAVLYLACVSEFSSFAVRRTYIPY